VGAGLSVNTPGDELEQSRRHSAFVAYASLLIYNKISAPGPLPLSLIPHTSVILYQTDGTNLIARGLESPYSKESKYDGINITSTCAVMEVHEVLVPGALIMTHRKCSLKDFGKPPFNIVCLRSHMQTISSTDSPSYLSSHKS
jgi:hypothetical protein